MPQVVGDQLAERIRPQPAPPPSAAVGTAALHGTVRDDGLPPTKRERSPGAEVGVHGRSAAGASTSTLTSNSQQNGAAQSAVGQLHSGPCPYTQAKRGSWESWTDTMTMS